jgi:hypothetical protein
MNRVSRLPIRRNNKKRYYKHIEYPEIAREINDLYITTSFGDRLDTLANLYYGDSSLWWIISCGNPGVVRRDSFFIPVGTQLRIPSAVEEIKRRFEELNF